MISPERMPTEAELELLHNFLELFLKGNVSEVNGVSVSDFPVFDVSYYPSLKLRNTPHFQWLSSQMKVYPDTPLIRTTVKIQGTVRIFKSDGKYWAEITIDEVSDPENPLLNRSIIQESVLSPNKHKITQCAPKGWLGHVYTTDPDGSCWSIHVHKPNEQPTQELIPQPTFVQGQLL